MLTGLLVVTVFPPMIQRGREAARRNQSRNNLKQIGLALHNYADTCGGLPPGGTFNLAGRGYHGWMLFLLPQMYSSPFYNYVNKDEPWDSTGNAGLFLNEESSYENPSEPKLQRYWEFPVAHYSANSHVMGANTCVRRQSIEHKERVFLVGELDGDFLPWGCPYNWREVVSINSRPATFGRATHDGCQFLFADDRVEFVSNNVSTDVLKQMNGEDLAALEANTLKVQRPTEFPCPPDALWFTWTYDGNGRVEVKRDIHGNVKSKERKIGK